MAWLEKAWRASKHKRKKTETIQDRVHREVAALGYCPWKAGLHRPNKIMNL